MKYKLIIASIATFSIIGIALLCIYRYTKEKNEVQMQIDWIFNSVASTSAEKMLQSQDTFFYLDHTDPSSVSENIVIENKDTTITIPKKDQHKNLSTSKVHNKAIQSLLFQRKEVNLNIIDSLFKEELHKHSFIFETAVRLTNNVTSVVFNSNTNGEFYDISFASTPVLCGLQDEAILQGFVRIPSSFIFSRIKSYLFLVITGGLIIIIALLFFSIYPLNKRVSEDTTQKPSSPFRYQITGDIIFDAEQYTLKTGREEYLLTPSCSKLLVLFLDSPDYFISYEDIDKKMWDASDIKHRREQVIKRLRESLEQMPQLQIRNVRGSGYKLYIEE